MEPVPSLHSPIQCKCCVKLRPHHQRTPPDLASKMYQRRWICHHGKLEQDIPGGIGCCWLIGPRLISTGMRPKGRGCWPRHTNTSAGSDRMSPCQQSSWILLHTFHISCKIGSRIVRAAGTSLGRSCYDALLEAPGFWICAPAPAPGPNLAGFVEMVIAIRGRHATTRQPPYFDT